MRNFGDRSFSNIYNNIYKVNMNKSVYGNKFKIFTKKQVPETNII